MGATGVFFQQWKDAQRTRQWSKALELAFTDETRKCVLLGNERHKRSGGRRRLFSERRVLNGRSRCLGTTASGLELMERQEGKRLW